MAMDEERIRAFSQEERENWYILDENRPHSISMPIKRFCHIIRPSAPPPESDEEMEEEPEYRPAQAPRPKCGPLEDAPIPPEVVDPKLRLSYSDFRIRGSIGRGAFAQVYFAFGSGRVLEPKKPFALKVLAKDRLSVNDTMLRHSLIEANALRLMESRPSPFIARMVGIFQTPHEVVLVTEFCPGGELLQVMEELESMQPTMLRFFSAGIILGLEFLHSLKIIFRDLKPENIMIGTDGYTKLVDFNLSMADIGDSPRAMTYCGTVDYMSPEMRCRQPYGRPNDWWALGVIMYEMMYGIVPFTLDDKSFTEEIDWPEHPCRQQETRDLVTSFLVKDQHRRLGSPAMGGAGAIKRHGFFTMDGCIDYFEEYEAKRFIPDYIPGEVPMEDQWGDLKDWKFLAKNFDYRNIMIGTRPEKEDHVISDFEGFDYVNPVLY